MRNPVVFPISRVFWTDKIERKMRKLFTKIHLWLSVPFGIIIAIVCLTGAILVFEQEILRVCYPSRYYVEEVKGEPLPVGELILAARRQLPDSIKINGIRIYPDPTRTYQLVLPGKKAAAFIDPYTGQVTGVDDGRGFFMQVMRLHRWLLDSNKRDGGIAWGKMIVGYSTLAMAVILLSGLVVWFPRNRKVLKNRLKVKLGTSRFRFWYDLHVAGGFYAALLLLALTLTGLTWSFGWYRNAFYQVFGVTATPSKAHAQTPKSPAGQGERRERQPDYACWETVLSTLKGEYADFNSITIQNGEATVSTADYGNTRGSDRYAFDPKSGEITGRQLYKDLPDSGKIRGWIYSVHAGTWGGTATRILSCLASFMGAVLSLTGYYMWLKRRR